MAYEEARAGDSFGGRPKRAWIYIASTAIGLSLFAFTILMANVAAGTPRQADENAWAHLFQLAMGVQLPLVLLFLAMADWRRRQLLAVLLAAQIIAAVAAVGALGWSGY